MMSRIWKEEKNTVIGLFISVLAGMLLITTIWKNDYTENIPFGILDEDRSSLSQSIVKQLGINPSLDIVYYADSEQDLKQAILDKKIEAGVMIPGNFSRDMSLKKSPQAVIFADCSNIITGGGAVGAASSVLGTMRECSLRCWREIIFIHRRPRTAWVHFLTWTGPCMNHRAITSGK